MCCVHIILAFLCNFDSFLHVVTWRQCLYTPVIDLMLGWRKLQRSLPRQSGVVENQDGERKNIYAHVWRRSFTTTKLAFLSPRDRRHAGSGVLFLTNILSQKLAQRSANRKIVLSVRSSAMSYWLPPTHFCPSFIPTCNFVAFLFFLFFILLVLLFFLLKLLSSSFSVLRTCESAEALRAAANAQRHVDDELPRSLAAAHR